MSNINLTEEQIAEFHENGYVIAKGYFSKEEVARLQETANNDPRLHRDAWHQKDSTDAVSKVCIWQETTDDLYSMFSRSRRLVDSCEKIIGEEMYHTSTKVMMKEPKVGGAWEWHQDYGYWHHDNLMLYPKAISCMVAMNKATQENGCLQVLKASHKLGRLNHSKTGDQKGAELKFVEEAMKTLELVYVELEPGDTLFFHCNLLHKSNQNTSDHPRWCMISAYNAMTNQPFEENEAQYFPLNRVGDDAILNWKEA